MRNSSRRLSQVCEVIGLLCSLQEYVMYSRPSKGSLTEEADGAAASNFSMNEVWENTTDQ